MAVISSVKVCSRNLPERESSERGKCRLASGQEFEAAIKLTRRLYVWYAGISNQLSKLMKNVYNLLRYEMKDDDGARKSFHYHSNNKEL